MGNGRMRQKLLWIDDQTRDPSVFEADLCEVYDVDHSSCGVPALGKIEETSYDSFLFDRDGDFHNGVGLKDYLQAILEQYPERVWRLRKILPKGMSNHLIMIYADRNSEVFNP